MLDWLQTGRPFLAIGLAYALAAGPARAEESPRSAANAVVPTLAPRIRDGLRDAHDRGADLYNGDDPTGCYRVFQGALTATLPLLSEHPDLQRLIESGLAAADRRPRVEQRAFALHQLIEEVRARLKEPAGTAGPGSREFPRDTPGRERAATLWERVGGEAAVRRVVDDFVALAANDPAVDFTRHGKFPLTDRDVFRLKDQFVDFVSAATGGPRPYRGRGMKEVHHGMQISDAQFDAALADLRRALEMNHVGGEDLRAILRAAGATRAGIVEAANATATKESSPKVMEKERPESSRRTEKKPDPRRPEPTKPKGK